MILKRIFRCAVPTNLLPLTKNDQELFVDKTTNSQQVKRITSSGLNKKLTICGLVLDCLLCVLISIFVVVASLSFLRLNPGVSTEKSDKHDHFFFYCFIVMVVLTITGLHFEGLILKAYEKFPPQVILVHSKLKKKSLCVLRMKVADDEKDEYVEAEVDTSNFTYKDLITLCCKELKLDNEEIASIRKYLNTKVRNDDDVKRFHRLEYLEVVTKKTV